MAKKITAEQMAVIIAANEAVKGTPNYTRFRMCYEYKHNRKWQFGGWGVPHTAEEKPIRAYGNTKYIMIDSESRFTITPEVEAIINQH